MKLMQVARNTVVGGVEGSGMCAPSASGVRALRIVYRRPCVQCFGVQSRVRRVRQVFASVAFLDGLEVSVCV